MATHNRREGRRSAGLFCFIMLALRGIRVNGFARRSRYYSRTPISASPPQPRSAWSSFSSPLPPTIIGPDSAIAMGRWSQNDELVGADRIKACIPYILPLIDGDQFGKYIYYTRFPFLGDINDFIMGPLVTIQHKVPFFGVGIFILLTLGTRFNTDINRNVRFSAQQAALIDVALIFPELIASGFVDQPLPRYIAEPCANFVWYTYMSVVLYCIYSNLTGKKPDQIPFISPTAELMVGPF